MDTDICAIETSRRSLWRHHDFRSLWFGQSISTVGSRITGEALPLAAVLALHASPLQMGWLQLVAAIPILLFGMFIGAMVDRHARRPFLIWTDFLRCSLLLVIPATAILGHLAMWMLFVIYPVLGLLTQTFNTAYQTYLPSLVGRAHLVEANTKLSITSSVAEIIGPGLAGTLVQVFTAPMTILLDACSYLISAVTLLRIRHSEPKRRPPSARLQKQTLITCALQLLREVRDGIRYIADDKTLLALTATAGVFALFAGIIFNMDVLYAIDTLHLHAAQFGLTVTVGELERSWAPHCASGSVRCSVLDPHLSALRYSTECAVGSFRSPAAARGKPRYSLWRHNCLEICSASSSRSWNRVCGKGLQQMRCWDA
ncbi:MFS transporter [Alicyclobacillus fastidiosus]|uniref:MFS transporter n=1 Tax=Alicyclobacillus fastidiosus TaxID=392011 RepID=A0ABY6ZFZ2_9BACL|nr:MFS transporter [Alicyclobacillus fastidiosus]WAH41030.1 MFS transporter [Alicyclobacillus fastidiosus]GMA62553.1 hypothetical protein GCM10025859_29930 [Alicyclobacillus fastidiosus]